VELIRAVYQATLPDRSPDVLAENIAREQSLELTRALIPDDIAQRLLGRVLKVSEVDEQCWHLEIGYPVELASAQCGQLLQLLYGNVSFYPRVRLVGLHLPDLLLHQVPGPIAGIAGIRSWTGVSSRALLMTVLKPRGSSPELLAAQAFAFASGGGDLIKDDQNLVEKDLETFRARISACAAAIDQAAQQTGRRCLYLPHVAGSGAHLLAQLDIVKALGLGGVVFCGWVMGIETVSTAARDRGLMWLSHPAMAGALTEPETTGITTAILLGTLARIAGADISIFPGRGGRISSGREDDERETCKALTEELGPIKPSLPCTGGGKTLIQAPLTAKAQGPDCAVLVGGDLIARGDRIQTDTRSTVAALEAAADQ
jgi:ribulose-bisphosphate carboxylase large chain